MILELAVPFRSLGVTTGEPVQFYVELLKGEPVVDRVPARRGHRDDRPLARLRTDHVASVNRGCDEMPSGSYT